MNTKAHFVSYILQKNNEQMIIRNIKRELFKTQKAIFTKLEQSILNLVYGISMHLQTYLNFVVAIPALLLVQMLCTFGKLSKAG